MFKFKTDENFSFDSFKSLLILTLALHVPWIQAAEETEKKEKVNCAKIADDDVKFYLKNGGKFKNDEEKRTYYEKAKKTCYSGGDEDGCKKDLSELNEARSKLVAACSEAKMSSKGSQGNIACSDAIKQCEKKDQVQIEAEDSDLPYNVEALQEQLNYCPSMAHTNLTELREEMKQAKEDMKEAQEALDDLEPQLSENEGDGQNQLIELAKQQQEAEKQCRDQQLQIEEGLQDGEKEIYNKVQEIFGQMQALSAQIGQTEQAKAEAGVRYNEARYNLELECHALALNKVNEKRKAIIAQVAKSRYSHGGMNNVFSEAGKPSRKKDQEEAKLEYTFCMQDASTKKKMSLARENYMLAAKAAVRQKDAYSEQMASMQKQMGQLQTSEVVQLRQRAQRQINNLVDDCAKQKQLFGAQQAQAFTQASKSKGNVQRQVDAKKQDLQEAKNSYDNIRDYYRAKNAIAGGESSEGGYHKAMAALADYEGKAQTFRQMCCGADVQGTESTCKEVEAYMGLTGTQLASTEADLTPEVPETNLPEKTEAKPSPAPRDEKKAEDKKQEKRKPATPKKKNPPKTTPAEEATPQNYPGTPPRRGGRRGAR